jgi:hypothetical protein
MQLAKKIRLEKTPIFRKKSYEKQFVYNEKVSEKISEAANTLERTLRR